ncbi:MAG TPA: tetratricopeptide repeat protein [Opitutaceae bacterium]|nr:tetratricopeptide repeat protein [Opitutaceae bacterium]
MNGRALPSRLVPCLACALVLAAFAAIVARSVGEWGRPPADYSNNLQAEALGAGHLYLPKAVPPGLAALPDPYDPEANLRYRMPPYSLHDLSYFRGRFYLYFGVTPVLLLFWPWAALTGHYLIHKWAVAIFCGAGVLAAAGLLRGLRRRYFPEVGSAVLACGILALGLATGIPVLLQRADVCEVPISCAFALLMLSLAAVGAALHRPERRVLWTAGASLAYGLAVGARPSVLFGALILLVPLWSERKDRGPGRGVRLLLAAAVPLGLCGAALAWYNWARFHSPLEFGQHYQLAADRQDSARHFSLRYLWFNFRVYFLAPVRLSPVFPYVREIVSPVPPAGHAPIEDPFGVLANIPVTLLALAAPLAWIGRPAGEKRPLRRLAAAAGLLFATSALVLGCFYGDCSRYEVEFLPALVLLAVLGIFGLERLTAGAPAAKLLARLAWGLPLAASIAFNLLCSAEHYAVERYNLGNFLTQLGRTEEAVPEFRRAVAARPDFAEAYDNLGSALLQLNRPAEAEEEFRRSLALRPGSVEAHNNLANALIRLGRLPEGIEQYRAALRINPDSAPMHYNLGNVFAETARWSEAAEQYREVVRIAPGFAPAHLNLAVVLYQLGQVRDAALERERALRLDPSLGAGAR